MLQWLLAIVVVLGVGAAGTWLAHGPLRRRHETKAGIAALSAMSWRPFIGIVLEALARRGFRRLVDRETAGGDSDYILIRNGDHWLLSAKHGSAFVLGQAAVKDLRAAMSLAGARGGLLLTQGRVDDSARQAAHGQPIELLDGAALWPELRDLVPDSLAAIREASADRARQGTLMAWLLALLGGVAVFALVRAPQAGTAAVTTQATPASDRQASVPVAVAPRDDEPSLDEQRDELARTLATLPMVGRAQWTSASTLEVTALEAGSGHDPFDTICPLVKRYPALASSRIQLTPPADSATPVRFRQCRSY